MSAPHDEKMPLPHENPPPYGFQTPQQQPGYPMYPQQTTTTTVITQPTSGAFQQTVLTSTPNTVILMPVGSESQRMVCPHCQADVSTKVKYSDGVITHVIAAVLCFVGCWPCCLIPYCVDACKNAEHTCPNCNRFIGRYNRL